MTRTLLDPTERLFRDIDLGGPPNRGGRRLLTGIAIAAGVALVIGVLVVIVARTASRQAGTPPATTFRPSPTAKPGTGSGLAWRTVTTVTPAGTAVQQQYDEAFSQGLGSQPGMTAAESLAVPAANITGGWPRLTAQDTPEGWASEFADGLLDISFAHQTRAALGPWLQAQEAPELIAGVPVTAADKVLYVSLLDPGLFGGQPTPVPSVAQWQKDASEGLSQSVSDLLVQIDPSWAQMIAAGWQPSDLRMTEEDMSGLITIRRGAHTVEAGHFSLQLILGTSRYRDGYGTVAVAGWTSS